MGLEVAYKAFVGNYAGFLESVQSFSDPDIDIATRVSNGEERVFNNHLVWYVVDIDTYILEVDHWVFDVVVDDFCLQISVPFEGVRNDVVEMDLEVQ